MTVAEGIALAEAKSLDQLAGGARTQLGKWGALIDQHRGDVPRSLVAVRIDSESSGVPTARSSADELGLLQLSPLTRQAYGVSESEALDPNANMRAGCALWADTACRMRTKHDLWSRPGSDYWGCSYCVLSIGAGAFAALVKAAEPARDRVLADLDIYVRLQGEQLAQLRSSFGVQSHGLVARRVVDARRRTMAAATVSAVDSTDWCRKGIGRSAPMKLWQAILFGLLAAGVGVGAYIVTPKVFSKTVAP